MINNKQYVPILKGKRGEFNALAKLPLSVLNNIVPVIDLVPPPDLNTYLKVKRSNDEYQNYLKKHFTQIVRYIKDCWRREKLFFVDGYMIQDIGLLKNDIHPIQYIFNRLLSEGYRVLPVIGNATSIEYNRAIKNIISKTNNGLCVRVFRLPSVDFNSTINELLNLMEIQPENIDLIIDLRSLEDSNLENIITYSQKIINRLMYLDRWRSLVLSGSGFPINLMDITADQIYLLSRIEWHNWKYLVSNNKIDRIVTYSDYGISHPKFPSYDSEEINISASIRYTGDDDFYIYRGRGTRQHGFEQFYDLSEMLINRPEYCSKKHCYGDNQIYMCGTVKKNTGNAETWRMIGTNHHITKVTDQLRQFFLSFNA